MNFNNDIDLCNIIILMYINIINLFYIIIINE